MRRYAGQMSQHGRYRYTPEQDQRRTKPITPHHTFQPEPWLLGKTAVFTLLFPLKKGIHCTKKHDTQKALKTKDNYPSTSSHYSGKNGAGVFMQRVWSQRNVDLNLFKEKIREFFEKNDFDVVVSECESTYHMLASGSPNYQIDGKVSVTVEGTPEDFSIRLEHERKSREKKHSLPITLAASLGFGLLLREEFKSDETFLDLRRDLWAFADRAVINLTGSAQTSCDTRAED